jgi:hypothetical protein
VNTYCVLADIIAAGLHVPVTPFTDVPGNAGRFAEPQNGPIGLNIGVKFGLMAMVSEAEVVQAEATVGVNE